VGSPASLVTQIEDVKNDLVVAAGKAGVVEDLNLVVLFLWRRRGIWVIAGIWLQGGGSGIAPSTAVFGQLPLITIPTALKSQQVLFISSLNDTFPANTHILSILSPHSFSVVLPQS
jgi:hypothetical protein